MFKTQNATGRYATGLSKVKLVDAGFIWTEPHSKRLKTKLTIQKEVLNGRGAGQSSVILRLDAAVYLPLTTEAATSIQTSTL